MKKQTKQFETHCGQPNRVKSRYGLKVVGRSYFAILAVVFAANSLISCGSNDISDDLTVSQLTTADTAEKVAQAIVLEPAIDADAQNNPGSVNDSLVMIQDEATSNSPFEDPECFTVSPGDEADMYIATYDDCHTKAGEFAIDGRFLLTIIKEIEGDKHVYDFDVKNDGPIRQGVNIYSEKTLTGVVTESASAVTLTGKKGFETGTGPWNSNFNVESEFVVAWDKSAACLRVDGSWKRTSNNFPDWGFVNWTTRVDGYQQCEGICPTDLTPENAVVRVDNQEGGSWSIDSDGGSTVIRRFNDDEAGGIPIDIQCVQAEDDAEDDADADEEEGDEEETEEE